MSRASTPPHGDYDYAYDSNDNGSDHGYYQQQQHQQHGQELDFTTGPYQQDYAAAAAPTAVDHHQQQHHHHPAAVVVDGGAGSRSSKKEAEGRTVSVGQLFGKTTKAVMASAQQRKSGLAEVSVLKFVRYSSATAAAVEVFI